MFVIYILAALAVAAADQAVKAWITVNLLLYGSRELIPGILSLTHVRNEGAAFSFLSGMQWLFVAIFCLLTAALLWEYFRAPFPFRGADRFLIAAIWGGGLGNMLDRIRLGYVTDMFRTDFMNFPVFNLADCFITCGCILLALRLLFGKYEKGGEAEA